MTGAHVVPADLHRDAILRAVGLNVKDPNAQALLLVCERYGLDPLLKHMVLIQQRPYITRDGYLHVAHASKQLDGIETLDEGETNSHWWATVAVYRKDMKHPFAYRGRYPKSGGNKNYGPEMAIKCAEVAALRRAFNVTGAGAADERWDVDDEHVVTVPNESAGTGADTAARPPVPAPHAGVEESDEPRPKAAIQGRPKTTPAESGSAREPARDRAEPESAGVPGLSTARSGSPAEPSDDDWKISANELANLKAKVVELNAAGASVSMWRAKTNLPPLSYKLKPYEVQNWKAMLGDIAISLSEKETV